MKALEIVEESDPQGTVVGVLGAVDLDPKQLLASGQVPTAQLYEAVLADRDRLLQVIGERNSENTKLREDLERALQMVECLTAQLEQRGARTL